MVECAFLHAGCIQMCLSGFKAKQIDHILCMFDSMKGNLKANHRDVVSFL